MTTITLALRLADADRALLARFVAALEQLADAVAPPGEPAPLASLAVVTLAPKGASFPPAEGQMAVSIPDSFDARIRLQQPRDSQDEPTSYDGPVTWESADPAVATVAAEDADGLVAFVTTVGVGATVITASADVKRGGDVDERTLDIAIEVVAGDAVGLAQEGVELVEKEQPAPAA